MITRFAAESSRNTQNLSLLESENANFSNFELNKKESSQNVITIQSTRKKMTSLILFTTSVFSKQINSFVASSSLLFDSFFQQFRSSFSSDSFTSYARSVSSSRFSAELHSDQNFSRIQKLDDILKSNKLSSNRSHKLNFSNSTSFTIITSAMSIFEENVFFHSASNLTQQNIQDIALFTFNLFALNV
jgi:hypothetical protein